MDMSATVEIERSPAEVWAFVIDVRNDPRWRTGIIESGLISPPPIAVGTEGFARTEKGEVRWCVRALEPGSAVDWDLATGPIRGSGGYRVKASAGGTLFTLVADVAPTGLLRALGPIFARIGRRRNEADVRRLKKILEKRGRASQTHRRVVVSRHGGPEVLAVVEAPDPTPGRGEVCVRVLAAGVSAFDLIYRRWGRIPGAPPLPFALGEDIVGLVESIGDGVEGLRVGEMVAGGTWALGVGGGYAELVCLPAQELVPVPDGVDPAEAVCLVVNYLTAHQHLHHLARARAGESMLVHGAAGGVGSAVLQLGKLAGLKMYGTASRENLDFVSSHGATPIDYRSEDFVRRIRELTRGGVDIVIDPIGGARQLMRSYRCLRRGGRLIWLGSTAVQESGIRVGLTSELASLLLRAVPDGRRVPRCPTMGEHALAHPDWYRTTLAELLEHLAARRIEPPIAGRIPLEEAGRAHAELEKGGHRGKFVLVPESGRASWRPSPQRS